MMKLFIEDQPIDINESFSILLTSAIDDIKNFGTRETTLSKTIILPGTKRNDAIFGFIFNTTTRSEYNPALPNYGYNFNAAISAKCLVLNGGFQQVKGTVRLLKVNINAGIREYEVAIVGELGGFVAKMGALKLTDLDFSAYDHTYSIANITATWATANAGAGYAYPLMDYGNYSTNKKDWKFGTLRPGLYVKEYIEKIVSQAGYTMDFPLLSTDRLKRWAVPYNRKQLTATNINILNRMGAMQSSYDAISVLAEMTTGTLGAFTTSDNANYIYYPTQTIVTNIECYVTIDSYTAYPDPIIIKLRKNGIAINQMTVTELGQVYDLSIAGVVLATSDALSVQLSSTMLTHTVEFTTSLKVDSTTALPTNVLIGDTVKGNDLIPQNILQVDFFRSILRMFNLYVTEDIYNERHLIITPYVTFHSGTEDWTYKIDRSKQIEVQPMSELNARYYEYKFKGDTDYFNELYKKRYNEGYGDRIYDSEFQFTNEKNSIELIFAATPLVGYSGEQKVYSTIFKQTGNAPTAVEEQIDSVIRLVQLKLVTGVPSWDILDSNGTTVLASQTEYLYAGHFDDPDTPANDLNWGIPKELFFVLAAGTLSVNQFSVYWSPYMAEITDKDSKLLTATIKLSLVDWYNLSFSKYKYIDGSLYRLNKITDYNASSEDICKAEFIKLIEKEY